MPPKPSHLATPMSSLEDPALPSGASGMPEFITPTGPMLPLRSGNSSSETVGVPPTDTGTMSSYLATPRPSLEVPMRLPSSSGASTPPARPPLSTRPTLLSEGASSPATILVEVNFLLRMEASIQMLKVQVTNNTARIDELYIEKVKSEEVRAQAREVFSRLKEDHDKVSENHAKILEQHAISIGLLHDNNNDLMERFTVLEEVIIHLTEATLLVLPTTHG